MRMIALCGSFRTRRTSSSCKIAFRSCALGCILAFNEVFSMMRVMARWMNAATVLAERPESSAIGSDLNGTPTFVGKIEIDHAQRHGYGRPARDQNSPAAICVI